VEEDTDGAQDAEIKMGVVGEMNGYQWYAETKVNMMCRKGVDMIAEIRLKGIECVPISRNPLLYRLLRF
jgi:hypothetical protein